MEVVEASEEEKFVKCYDVIEYSVGVGYTDATMKEVDGVILGIRTAEGLFKYNITYQNFAVFMNLNREVGVDLFKALCKQQEAEGG